MHNLFAYHNCDSYDDAYDLDSVLCASQHCGSTSVSNFLHHYI